MISPKRIERLWAACPELRPDGLHLVSITSQTWIVIGNPDDRRFDVPLSDRIAHALIRDKIVWWMSNTKCCEFARDHAPPDEDDAAWWEIRSMIGDCPTLAVHADPTLACVLAAERVLNLPDWTEPT